MVTFVPQLQQRIDRPKARITSNHDSANIISVAASNQLDELAYFRAMAKLPGPGAPGTSILNLIPMVRLPT